MPKRIVELLDQPEALRKAVVDHIHDEAGALRGQLVEWDVVNEPYTNHALQDVLGEEVLVEWFKAAREADPKVKLDINDYSILSSGGKDQAHQDHYERTIRMLLEKGAPLQGIGMQSHFDANLTPIPRLLQVLDRFAKLGLPIQSTEFDVNVADEQLQADYTRDFMTALFSHPSVHGIITWGFWESRHWIPNAAHYRKDWSVRPAGDVWRKLVFHEWWTNEAGQTAANGEYTARGFLGDYEVEVRAGGKTKTTRARLDHAGVVVEIALP